jgi:spore germination cell wall hydrolase CwlJ-like protein
VGIVVLNRVNHETYFADTIKDVIYEKGQFGPASNGRLSKALKMYDAGTLPEDAINAAKYVLDGNTSVFYKGENIEMSSYLYFNTTVKNPKKQIQYHYFK